MAGVLSPTMSRAPSNHSARAPRLRRQQRRHAGEARDQEWNEQSPRCHVAERYHGLAEAGLKTRTRTTQGLGGGRLSEVEPWPPGTAPSLRAPASCGRRCRWARPRRARAARPTVSRPCAPWALRGTSVARSVCLELGEGAGNRRQHFGRRRRHGRAQERLNLLEPREDRTDRLAVLRHVAGRRRRRGRARPARRLRTPTVRVPRSGRRRTRRARAARAPESAARAGAACGLRGRGGLRGARRPAARRSRAARATRPRTRACPAAARWRRRSRPR